MRYLLVITFIIPFLGWAQEFPRDWVGLYDGEMIVAHINQPTDTVPVSFECVEMIADSVWSYTMVFNSKRYGTIEKNYNIVAKRKGNTVDFLLDENNGIVMDLTYLNGTFYGVYEVMDTYYVTTFQYRTDGLYYDLFAAPVRNERISSTNGETPIEANSYKPILHQTVLFKARP